MSCRFSPGDEVKVGSGRWLQAVVLGTCREPDGEGGLRWLVRVKITSKLRKDRVEEYELHEVRFRDFKRELETCGPARPDGTAWMHLHRLLRSLDWAQLEVLGWGYKLDQKTDVSHCLDFETVCAQHGIDLSWYAENRTDDLQDVFKTASIQARYRIKRADPKYPDFDQHASPGARIQLDMTKHGGGKPVFVCTGQRGCMPIYGHPRTYQWLEVAQEGNRWHEAGTLDATPRNGLDLSDHHGKGAKLLPPLGEFDRVVQGIRQDGPFTCETCGYSHEDDTPFRFVTRPGERTFENMMVQCGHCLGFEFKLYGPCFECGSETGDSMGFRLIDPETFADLYPSFTYNVDKFNSEGRPAVLACNYCATMKQNGMAQRERLKLKAEADYRASLGQQKLFAEVDR